MKVRFKPEYFFDSPQFTTRYLRVFRVSIQSTEDNFVRAYYLAFTLDEEIPFIVASATVWEGPPFKDNQGMLEGISIDPNHGNQEQAMELYVGLKDYFFNDLIPAAPSTIFEYNLYKKLGVEAPPMEAKTSQNPASANLSPAIISHPDREKNAASSSNENGTQESMPETTPIPPKP